MSNHVPNQWRFYAGAGGAVASPVWHDATKIVIIVSIETLKNQKFASTISVTDDA